MCQCEALCCFKVCVFKSSQVSFICVSQSTHLPRGLYRLHSTQNPLWSKNTQFMFRWRTSSMTPSTTEEEWQTPGYTYTTDKQIGKETEQYRKWKVCHKLHVKLHSFICVTLLFHQFLLHNFTHQSEISDLSRQLHRSDFNDELGVVLEVARRGSQTALLTKEWRARSGEVPGCSDKHSVVLSSQHTSSSLLCNITYTQTCQRCCITHWWTLVSHSVHLLYRHHVFSPWPTHLVVV